MADIKSLAAKGLPQSFVLERHGEKPIISLSFQERTIRLVYRFPGFSLADLAGASGVSPAGPGQAAYRHEVGISGTGFLSESGKPLLPSFGRFLQIPIGYDYTISVKKSGLRKRKNISVRPAQEKVRDQEAWTLEFDRQTYSTDRYYPSKIVDVSQPFYLDGYRVLCIHVRPLQYNPVKELLRGFSSIEIAITFSETPAARKDLVGKGEVAPWMYLDHKHNLEGFGNFLFNPERKYFEKEGLFPPKIKIAKQRPKIPAFLIIYGEIFETPVRKLQAWKQKCGLTTDIVPLTTILGAGGSQKSRQWQVDTIKAYIRAQRRIPWSPLRYVLLFGDVNVIPTEERQRPEASWSDTTDYYYFTHRDAEESECLLPWIAGGRIAAVDENDGMAAVDQIIAYEKNPPDESSYFKRMAVAAYFEDRDAKGRQDGRANQAYMKTMETIRDHMQSHGFEVNRVYVANTRAPEQYSDGTPVPLKLREELIYKTDGALATKKLIDLINQGQLIIGHRGHGDRSGWMNPPLRMEDLRKIKSAVPSVFFSINCRTGSFDSGRECFADAALALPGGAPSLIAATELSGSWRNDSMIKALFDAIWPGVIPTYPVTTLRFPVKYYRMGDILNYAKTYLLLSHGMNANTQKHFEIYHVVGDPTLHVWGSEPLTLQLHARLKKDILVVNMNTCPREAFLSVWFEDECLLTLAPSGTRLAIPLMLLDKLPDDALDRQRDRSYKLSVFFAAAGHRMAAFDLWF